MNVWPRSSSALQHEGYGGWPKEVTAGGGVRIVKDLAGELRVNYIRCALTNRGVHTAHLAAFVVVTAFLLFDRGNLH